MSNSAENDLANQHYNQLTGLKLFAMTSSMVISIDEFAPFGKTGATALFYLLLAGLIWFLPVTQAAGEMASIDGWQKGASLLGLKIPLAKRPALPPCFTSGSTLLPGWT